MKPTLLAVIIGCTAAFSLLGYQSVFAHGNVDQASEPGFGFSSPCGFGIGQSFTPTKPNLIGIDMFLELVTGNPNITLEIRSGTFNGPLLGTTSKVVADGSDKIEHFDFSLIRLTPGNTYVIRTECGGGESFLWTEGTTGYSGGEGFFGEIPPGDDFGFRTYFDPQDNLSARKLSSPSNVHQNDLITGTVAIRNTGLLSIQSYDVSLFFSTNKIWDQSDVLIGTTNVVIPIAPGSTANVSIQGNIPDGSGLGTRYLIAVVDPDNQLSEVNENDNAINKKLTVR